MIVFNYFQETKVEVAREAKEIEDQREKIAKLDHWLETINNELKESTKQTDVLIEEDIIKYIEIYERYIKEYEEYEIILKSITVISQGESSQSLRDKLKAMQNALGETKNLVIIEIERLRQVLLHIRSAPEIVEDDISQTDRTIDSTSMPEEVVTPRDTIPEDVHEKTAIPAKEVKVQETVSEKIPTVQESKPEEKKLTVTMETQTGKSLRSESEKSLPKEEAKVEVKVQESKPAVTNETQTGQSLMSDAPSVSDKSVICQPEVIRTHDVAITCAAPQEVEIQTCDPQFENREILENIQVRQTISDGHETIEIASKPVYREQRIDDQSLLVDAKYRDDALHKDSQLNITHSLPQSFETVMVEPDETTTEVIVDADGTKRIIVKKVRKTLVTRQQTVQTQQHRSQILSSEGVPHEQSFSQITLKEDKGSTSTMMDDGGVQHLQYQTYGGQVISGLPGGEVTIQEFTSRPDMVIQVDKTMNPEEILQLAEGEHPQIHTSSSSVTAVVQQVTKRIVRTRRRIIRRVVIIDGKEHVTEEIIEEPDSVEVQEEQIPRVSISVRDHGGVQFEEIDDSHDKGDQPPALPPGSGKDDKPEDRLTPKDKEAPKERDSPKDEDSPKDRESPTDRQSPKDRESPKSKESQKSPKDKKLPRDSPIKSQVESVPTQAQNLQGLMQEFMQKESEYVTTPQTIKSETIIRTSQERERSPVQTVTISETFQTLPSDIDQTYQVEEPQDGQSTVIGHGVHQTTLETSSSNIATVVQKVTRKITRTRKRIIKHIQIIDGKEHVTEEVIEEPDDVEVIEEEPKVSTHTVQEQGVKTKRIRIIRQVQIIDGKEHVTEQVVEEPDDEYVPETTVTADIDVQLSKAQEESRPSQTSQVTFTEIEQKPTATTETIVTVIPEPQKETHTVTQSPLEIQKDATVINVTESLIGSEIDHFGVSQTPTKEPVPKKRKDKKSKKGKKSDTSRDDSTTSESEKIPEVTKVTKEIVEKLEKQTEPDIVTVTTTKEIMPIVEEPADVQQTLTTSNVTSTSLTTDVHKQTNVIITRTRKRIIKHIQIIDGKEHVTEEVIEEPDDVEIVEGEPKLTHTVQDAGVRTKRIRIIRQVQIIDGKEHVTDQVVEDPDDEYVPDSTVTAEIDVQISKPEMYELRKDYDKFETTTVSQKDPTVIDVSKSFIGSEIDQAISQEPSQPVAKKREKKSKKGKVSDELPKDDIAKEIERAHSVLDVPKTTEISAQIVQETVKDVIQPKVTETITTTKITTVIPETESQKDTTIIDITKSLIGSESDHSAVSQPVPKKREKKRKRDSGEQKESPIPVVSSPKEEIKPIVEEVIKTTKPVETPTKDRKDKTPSPKKDVPIVEELTETSTAPITDETTKILKTRLPVEKVVSPEEDKTRLLEKVTTIEEIKVKTTSPVKDITLNGSEKQPEEVKIKSPSAEEISIDFLTKETDDYKQQINILELTKQLLEKESIHAGHIHSPVKMAPMETSEKVEPSPRTEEVKPEIEPTLKQKETVEKNIATEKTTEISVAASEQPVKTSQELIDLTKPEVAEQKPSVTSEQTTVTITKTVTTEPTNIQVTESINKDVLKGYIPSAPETMTPMSVPMPVTQSVKETKPLLTEEPTIDGKVPISELTKEPSEKVSPTWNVVELTKDLLIQEGIAGVALPVPSEKLITEIQKTTSRIVTEQPPVQSTVQVEPVKVENVVTESITTLKSEAPEFSYIQQYEPKVQSSTESVDKLAKKEFELEPIVMPSEALEIIGTVPVGKSDQRYDINLLLQSERQDNLIRGTTHSVATSPPTKHDAVEITEIECDKPQQTVDISMSIARTDVVKKDQPKVQFDVKVGGFESNEPFMVKKDIDVHLPSELVITQEPFKTSAPTIVEQEEPIKEKTPEDSMKDHKKSKKRKKKRSGSDSNETEVPTETDKSIADTDSSSLSHYVELPTSPPVESPKPTEDVLRPAEVVPMQEPEPDSLVTESEPATEELGYEPEDVSLDQISVPDKKKRQKKRKPHGLSEETTYPKMSTTDSDDTNVSTPVEIAEPAEPVKSKKGKAKKGKKKTPSEIEASPEPEPEVEQEPEVKPESPKIGSEVLETSPREESYRTMSEASDISTVKIVEECVHSSPETVKTEVSTTITYPVPVVEEIPTQEYSVQTSPEVVEEKEPVKEIVEAPRPETAEAAFQTSPTPVSDSLIQTSPVEDKEAHTQTIEEVTVVEKIEKSDSQMQTSREESPEPIIQTEATTQVIPHDINAPEEKFSQTSPIEEPVVPEEKPATPIVVTESKEMQTSPIPQVEKDEKSTEIIVETIDTDIQTVKQEIVDRETSTSPIKEKVLTEISSQTPEVPLVSSYTQSDTPEHVIKETPKVEEPPKVEEKPEVKEEPAFDLAKKEVVTVDSTQQTSPREYPEEPVQVPQLEFITREIVTVDSTQQTSPRVYSEDSISTSTDEPYEVHLRAQISIPQATNDFIDNERQVQPPQSIISEKQKHKKRKSKKKAESPMTPESLSDPITTELSMSLTPTSEDFSSRDPSSIDEGISQLASPMSPMRYENNVTQHKPTYSSIVQRSKSKSPSPCKSFLPRKSEKARLLDALEKRTQSVTEPQKTVPDESMAVALLEPSVEKSYDLVVNKELDEVKHAVEDNDPTRVERSVIVVIETISIWLEEIRYKIQRGTISGSKNTEETERLNSLQSYVQSLKEIIEVTEVNEEIITLIETLTRQVSAVNTLSNQSSVKVIEVEKEWQKFLEDTDELNQTVERVKASLDDIVLSDIPTQQKLDRLDKIDSENVDNCDGVRKLFRRYRILVEANPKRECPMKLYNCDDDTKQIDNVINTERDRLLQLTSLAEEYEQTLQDFGQITEVAEALLDGKIIVSNLDHLREEIQKHRKFFVNLSHCRAILESLEDNLDSETRAKYASLHNSLHDRATTIIDRAASRAQQMTLSASRWTVLEQGMKEEQQWLRVAHQRVPDLTNVTSRDHEQYINLYQSISLDVSHHYAKILRLLSITEGLRGLIVCSGLDTECSTALDTLLALQEDVDSRLTRLTAFKENWLTYDHLIDRVEGWMKIANKELEQVTPENITTTGNLRRFWELKAQHEVYNNLKNESGVQFEKALEILPISDEMVQRQFFSKIEDKWRDLSARIGNIHASAIQNISDRDVSSGEKLNILEDELRELRASVDSLKGVIKSEDELNLYIERLQVMTGRIDRIQNELGRLSLLPTAESERLGALLTQSGILNDQISEELERSLLLKEKIVQVQAGISRCQKSQRRARLTLEECEAAERLGSDVVERASENCDRLLEDLATQWRDILALRQALHTLPTSLRVCVSPTGVERDISALQVRYLLFYTFCRI